jgi:hypothetical protein
MPELFSKIVTLQVEDSVKQKTLHLQSCREFHDKRSRYKIHLIPSPDGRVRPNLVRPKMGRWESERLYKGRNPAKPIRRPLRHLGVAPRTQMNYGPGPYWRSRFSFLLSGRSFLFPISFDRCFLSSIFVRCFLFLFYFLFSFSFYIFNSLYI